MRGMKLIGLSLLLAAGAASAQVTGTVTVTSDYDFRGVSQSATEPAIQGSIDWAHESGFYAGAWGSTIDFSTPSFDFGEDIEIDLYAGFAQEVEGGISWEAGIVYYTYPGAEVPVLREDVNYFEGFVGGGLAGFSAKLWYSDNYFNSDDVFEAAGLPGGASAWYLEVNYTFQLPEDFSLDLHAGTSRGDYWDTLNAEYEDYSVGVNKSFSHFDFNLKYVYPDVARAAEITADEFNNEDRVILTVSTTFPWSNE